MIAAELSTAGASGPIACSWQAIAEDVSNTFQAPAVIQPSIMATHAQTIQSGVNAVASAAQSTTAAAQPQLTMFGNHQPPAQTATGVKAPSAVANAAGSAVDTKTTTEYVAQKLSQSKELQSLQERVQALNKTVPDTRYGNIDFRVKGDSVKFLKADSMAEAFYESVRKSVDDVQKIAQNTGIDGKIIERIKNHVFLEEHVLPFGRISKFDAMPDMADAWKRLADGSFVQSDLKLLLHEYAESLIMQGDKVAYDQAHYIIDQIGNKYLNWHDFI